MQIKIVGVRRGNLARIDSRQFTDLGIPGTIPLFQVGIDDDSAHLLYRRVILTDSETIWDRRSPTAIYHDTFICRWPTYLSKEKWTEIKVAIGNYVKKIA